MTTSRVAVFDPLVGSADLVFPDPPEGRPHTFFNFVTTLDGRAALDGSTRPLGGPADLELLLALRAAADAVLIGPSTVRAEGYGQLVSAERRADTPPAVLISRRFDIP